MSTLTANAKSAVSAIGNSLIVRGIHLKPWHHCTEFTMFQWRTFDGLLLFTDDKLVINALMSDAPGSGKLHGLISIFEEVADENRVPIVVVHFWNKRLREWFRRRGYTIGETLELGSYAMRDFASAS